MADSVIKRRVGRFHPKCASTALSEDRRVASGKGYGASHVFSNDPIPIGVQFSVEILQRSSILVSPISASSIRPDPIRDISNDLNPLDAPYIVSLDHTLSAVQRGTWAWPRETTCRLGT